MVAVVSAGAVVAADADVAAIVELLGGDDAAAAVAAAVVSDSAGVGLADSVTIAAVDAGSNYAVVDFQGSVIVDAAAVVGAMSQLAVALD